MLYFFRPLLSLSGTIPRVLQNTAMLCLLSLAGTTDAAGTPDEDSAAPQAQPSKVLTVGVVPQFAVSRLHQIWKPILDNLSQQTGYQFELQGAADIPAFEREFLAGQYDIAYMNPYHYLLAEAQYRPLLKDLGRQLYGIVVVRKDSPVTSMEQLEDQVIAFPAPNALGASLMIRAALGDQYAIDYDARYVKTHSSVYLNVLLGQAAAGGGVQKTFNQQPAKVRDQLRILYQTPKVAPHPLVVNRQLPDDVVEKIRQAFLVLAATDQGKALLKKVPFRKLGPATAEDYHPLRSLNLRPYSAN